MNRAPMSKEAQSRQMSSGSTARSEETAQLYKEVFTHSNEAIAIISPDGYYLEQNVAHENLVGYSDEELYGKTPAIHMGEETFALIARVLSEKGEYFGEITSRTKSGEARQIELSAFAMKDASGIPVCYVGIKRDITERK